MVPLPAQPAPAALPAMPAVPELPLPPIVSPPDGDRVLPAAALPAIPVPASTSPPAVPAIPVVPAAPVPPASVPAIPVVPTTATPPAVSPSIPTIPAPAPMAKPAALPTTPMVPPLPVPPAPTPAPPMPIPVPPATTPLPTILLSSPGSSGPAVAPSPAPVQPSAPQEPRPLPLPAPTPFTPGLDSLKPEPAANLVPTGSIAVLKGNKLIEGKVTVSGDKVVVRQGALDRTFLRSEVLFVGANRDDVYRFMLAKVPAGDAAARYAVARWCSLNGLREQALTEAQAIMKLKPDHRAASDLARSTEESLRLFPADGSAPVRTGGALVTVEEPEPDVSPEGATAFAARAQPVLANQCMECHARADHGSGFKLVRVTGFEVGPQATHANLRAVAAQLKKNDPGNSPLLVKSLIAHGGMRQPAFVSRQSAGYRQLESWVAVAVAHAAVPTMPQPTPPLIAPALPVSPIPPAVDNDPQAAKPGTRALPRPALPPVDPAVVPAAGTQEIPAAVPPVLPTPPSIPVIEPGSRGNSRTIPSIPAIPVPAATPVPPAGRFGSESKPAKPAADTGTRDEFDPAGFNRSVPRQ